MLSKQLKPNNYPVDAKAIITAIIPIPPNTCIPKYPVVFKIENFLILSSLISSLGIVSVFPSNVTKVIFSSSLLTNFPLIFNWSLFTILNFCSSLFLISLYSTGL